MIKIGITGGKGNLGSSFIKQYRKKYKFFLFNGNITNFKEVNDWVAYNKFDLIIHAAGIVEIEKVKHNKKKAYDVNVKGTKNLATSILKNKKKIKFVYISTAQTYGFKNKKIKENDRVIPKTLYGIQKLNAEMILENYFKNNADISLLILRVFSFTTINQNNLFVVPAVCEKLKKKSNSTFATDKFYQRRDFIHINDLCRAIDFLIRKKIVGILNVGSGIGTPIDNIIKFFAKKFNVKIIYKKKDRKQKNKSLVADVSKLKKLGFKTRYSLKNILNTFSQKNIF